MEKHTVISSIEKFLRYYKRIQEDFGGDYTLNINFLEEWRSFLVNGKSPAEIEPLRAYFENKKVIDGTAWQEIKYVFDSWLKAHSA